jgi:uncharacterized protein YcbX
VGVLAIWRYPVKAMLGELLRCARIAPGGIEGDRRWVVTDADTGERIANKRGPTDPRLRACRAALDGGRQLVVTLPDGRTSATGTTAAGALLSELLERRVALVAHERGSGGFLRTDGHHDFAPLHLLTNRSLDYMSSVAPDSDWDVRRFRPNVLLDDGCAASGLSEPDVLGAELAGPSGITLTVGLPTPRCVVPTRAREELPRAPKLLAHVAGASRWDLGPFGRPACLGVYAEVAIPGTLTVDERLFVTPRHAPTAQAAVAATVERVVAAQAIELPTTPGPGA